VEVWRGGVTVGWRWVAATKTVRARSSSTQPGEWSDRVSVADVPETHYTRSADGISLAYHVSGDGPLDLAFAPGSPVATDLLWDDPGLIRVSNRLGTFTRTVWLDPRGFGTSEGDPLDSVVGTVSGADLGAVLDAAGCQHVALLGWGVHGGRAIEFSVTHPERMSACA